MAIRPGALGFEELKAAVQQTVLGAPGAAEAQVRINEPFACADGTSISVTLIEGADEFSVLNRPVEGAKLMSFRCRH